MFHINLWSPFLWERCTWFGSLYGAYEQIVVLKKIKSFILFIHSSIIIYKALTQKGILQGGSALTSWEENTGETQRLQQYLAYAFQRSIPGLWRCNWQWVVPSFMTVTVFVPWTEAKKLKLPPPDASLELLNVTNNPVLSGRRARGGGGGCGSISSSVKDRGGEWRAL